MIQIATASDDAYAPWAAAVIRSALDHREASDITFHLLHDHGLSSATAERLTDWVRAEGGRLEMHEVELDALGKVDVVDRFGSIVLLRFLLPELLPATGRIIYLDADTLVAGPLSELWESDLGGAPLAAVRNVVEPRMRDHVAGLGIAEPERFFNSGVLLMDLEALRAENATERLISLSNELREQLVWPDQDILNVAFAGRWHELHPRWNAMNSLWVWRDWAEQTFGEQQVREATEGPGILHFEGPAFCKPWHYLSSHPWTATYRRVLSRTPWSSAAPQERTLSTRLIARLPARYRGRAYWQLKRRQARGRWG